MIINEALSTIYQKKNLSFETAEAVIDEIMSGKCEPSVIGAFLAALHMKGETPDEISGCASGMRKHSLKVKLPYDTLEIVGTGGDRANSINISTLSALVVAAAGIPVTKHGNRAASSKCGAADCLEALGIKLSLEPDMAVKCIEKTNFCFLFAQKYHAAMKYVAPVRKLLGVPTVFNILGPLTNPASASYQLLGVYSEDMVKPMAAVLSNLGVKRGMSVFGKDGLDEISLSSPTVVCEFADGEFKDYIITPEQFGFESCDKSELVGGTPEENAQIVREILSGKKGAKRNAVLLNSGAALHIAKPELSIADGIKLAASVIDSGKALANLEEIIKTSNEE